MIKPEDVAEVNRIDLLVSKFAACLKKRLLEQAASGKVGWDDEAEFKTWMEKGREQFDKEYFIDAAAYTAFAWFYSWKQFLGVDFLEEHGLNSPEHYPADGV